MGFRNKLLLSIIFVCIGYELSALQSESENVDINYIYNKWVLLEEESSSGTLIFRNEAFFSSNSSDEKTPNRWRFAEHSDVFVNSPYRRVKIYKKQIGRPRRTCGPAGSEGRSIGRYYYSSIQRTKGRWKLCLYDEKAKIKLLYYKADIGKPFKLSRTQVYEIVHLEKDLMILRKDELF